MNPCQETSGFLFKHACGRPATMTCLTCLKAVCAQHARTVLPEGFRCVTCALLHPGDTTTESDWDDDDPYFYRESHAGPATDPMDFTDGDRASVAGEGGTWEDDPAGS